MFTDLYHLKIFYDISAAVELELAAEAISAHLHTFRLDIEHAGNVFAGETQAQHDGQALLLLRQIRTTHEQAAHKILVKPLDLSVEVVHLTREPHVLVEFLRSIAQFLAQHFDVFLMR